MQRESGGAGAAQQYAVQLLENVATCGGSWATRFATQGVADRLLALTLGEGSPCENLQVTAASAMSRLARHSPQLLPYLVSNNSFRALLQGLPRSLA